jgi:dTDP-4-dehydrorhamnose reductase
MNIAIIGTGFVAKAYARALHYLGECPMMLSRSWIDYTRREDLKLCLINHKTEMVINCAGYTGETVDDCEINYGDCSSANGLLPVTIAEVCASLKIRMIHISSGCIFDGDGYFKETDTPNFISNYYQQCKYEAEQSIMKVLPFIWIFRIRMPFSHNPNRRNWIDKLDGYHLILDGLNSVTWIDELALRSWQLWQKASPGIYHAAQRNPIMTADAAAMIKGKIKKHNIDEFNKTHVKRSEATLDCSKFEKAYGTPFTDTKVALRWCIPIWKNGGGTIRPYEQDLNENRRSQCV